MALAVHASVRSRWCFQLQHFSSEMLVPMHSSLIGDVLLSPKNTVCACAVVLNG